MVKFLCDLNWKRNEPNEDDSQRMKKSSAHRNFLTSKFFAGTVSLWLCGVSVILKFVVVPMFYNYALQVDLFDKKSIWMSFPPLTVFLVFTQATVPHYHFRYWKKEWVQEEFRWWHIFKALNTYWMFVDIALHIVFPLCKQQINDRSTAPHAIIGVIVLIMDLLALYSFSYCDFIQLIDHHEDLELYDCYQKTFEPMPLTIVESTPTYITLKNISRVEVIIELNIHRTVEVCDQTNRRHREKAWSEVSVDFATETTIPPGSVFKLTTTEFQETEDEPDYVFRIDKLRSFGCKKGYFVKTTVAYKGETDCYRVELIEKYERPEAIRKIRLMNRRYRPNTLPTFERREITSQTCEDVDCV